MRITAHERQTIREAVARHFGPDVRVRLFGSRVDDAARGGDIDLFLDAVDLPASEVVRRRIDLRLDLYDRIGEQRIDVVVRRKDGPELPIHQRARETGVVL